MGSQRTWQRQSVLLYAAVGLIAALLLAGCSTLKLETGRLASKSEVTKAERLQSAGRFSQAMDELRQAIERSPDEPPGDLASYRLGILMLHPDNPARDTRQALESFRRVRRMFPDSPYAQTSEVWIHLIRDLHQARQQEATSRQKLSEAREALSRARQDVRNLREQFEAFKRIDLESNSKRVLPDSEQEPDSSSGGQ